MYEKVFYQIVFTLQIYIANGVSQGGQFNNTSNSALLRPSDETANPPVYDEAGILILGDGNDAATVPSYDQNENIKPDAGTFPGENYPANFPGNQDGPNPQNPGMDIGILSSEVISLDGRLDALDILDRNKPEPGFDLTQAEIVKFKLWPDGLIPYYIDVISFSDKVLRDKIRSYLSSINSLTSLTFAEIPNPPANNSRYVFFINRRGLLGCGDHSILDLTLTGAQHVVLGYHCMSTQGELAEAVLTIAGVPPMHNAPGRDYYIKVNEKNIMPDKKYLFRELDDSEWLFHDLDYDFESAGHYNSYKYSVNGRATIEPQDDTVDVTVGETTELSAIDILKIRMLYNYIVRQKMLEGPECHRLFEPGSKFSEYKPSKEVVKPREKPARYTGDTENARPDGSGESTSEIPYPEDSHGIVTLNPEDQDGPDYNNPQNDYTNDIPPNSNDIPPNGNDIPPNGNDIPPNGNDITPNGNDIPPNGNDIPSYDYHPDDSLPKNTGTIFTTKAIEDSSPLYENEDDDILDYVNKGEGPPIINIGPPHKLKHSTRHPISFLIDYHDGEKLSLSLKSPIQNQKQYLPDKISELSDFGTSHEANKQYDNVNDIKQKTLQSGQHRQRFKFRGIG